MINLKNKKKLIAIGVLITIFIIYVLFAFFSSKSEVEEIPNVPWGESSDFVESSQELNSYVSIDERETNLTISSIELLNIIKNPNMSLNSFGEYYIYDNYYVFPKRQIKIRKSFDKILSIIFLNEYKYDVIKNINVKTNSLNLINNLGTANYNENGLIVYKTKDCYINFDTNNNQIAVYMRYQEDLAEFWQFYDIYLQTNNLKRYIADITRKYPTYTKYVYDSDGLELIYAELGIRLYFKEFNPNNGIYIYSNYDNTKELYSIDNLQKKPNVIYKNFNLVIKEEIERITDDKFKSSFSWPEKIYSDNKIYKHINVMKSYLKIVPKTDNENEYKKLEKLSKYTLYYDFNNLNYTFNNVSVISKINNNNFNINTAKVADYLLLTEEHVFFSIINEGIFRLNVNTGVVVELYIGQGVFELKYIKDNYLYYDDLKIRAL